MRGRGPPRASVRRGWRSSATAVSVGAGAPPSPALDGGGEGGGDRHRDRGVGGAGRAGGAVDGALERPRGAARTSHRVQAGGIAQQLVEREPGQQRGGRRYGPSTPASANVAISRADARGRDEREREQRAGGLAEAQAQVEQRLEPELDQGQVVAGLGRPVARDEPLADRRIEPDRGERGHRRRVAVEHHREAAPDGLGDRAGERDDLEAAERRERAADVVALAAHGARAPRRPRPACARARRRPCPCRGRR